MISPHQDYGLYFRFLKAFTHCSFRDIDFNDPLMSEMEKLTEINDQFIYINDAIHMKVMFTSARSRDLIGIEACEVSPFHFMEVTHPDDIQRLNLGRAKVLKMAQELYIAKKGDALISTNFRMRTPEGTYSEFLIQCYIYYTEVPYKTAFFLKVHTRTDWFKKRKHGFHYYVGNDHSYFRYPDEKLLMTGIPLSDHEFEIVRLIESGLSSEQIGEKLFLSVHTINTHRRNILEKTGHSTIAELIYSLKDQGLL
jgi:DNA-binding CsgD family transcriptional regulator